MIRESKRHPSQVIEELPGGGVIFTVTVSGMEEIGSWILGWGSEAEVIEPLELRAKMLETGEEMVRTYRPKK